MNFFGTEIDIPFLQNPFTPGDKGAVPFLQNPANSSPQSAGYFPKVVDTNYPEVNYNSQNKGKVQGVSASAPAPAAPPRASGPSPADVAAAQKRANLTRNLQVSQQGAEGGSRQAAMDVGNTYDAQVRNFLNTIRGGQDQVNQGRVNTGLNLRRSMSDIISGVRTGLRSGGVQLANMNAVDSGAADAMARAYAKVGNQQVGDVTNDALVQNQTFDQQQGTLNRQRDESLGGFDKFREQEVSRIRNELWNKLNVLNTQGQNEGVNGVVDMGIVDRVVGDAVARLAAVDAMKGSQLAGVTGLTPEQIAAEAARLDAMGAEGTSPFGTPETATMQGAGDVAGAPISQLPIYVRRRPEAIGV